MLALLIFRFDAVEQIEDSLTGLKVIDFDGKCFRLSMQTYIPTLEESSFQHKIEDVIEPSEVNHELLIEVIDGTMEIKNVEVWHALCFPNMKSFHYFIYIFSIYNEVFSVLLWHQKLITILT